MIRNSILLAGVFALAGCAYPSPQHIAALNGLVGRSETDLIRTYGVPNRVYDSGGHRFLAYNRSRIDTVPGDPGFIGYGPYWGGGWGGWGGWGGFPPEVIQRECETTFELSAGVVTHWGLRGNDC